MERYLNIEQAGMLAAPLVLGDDAGGILHWKRVATKRHHAPAKRDVPIIENNGLEVGCRNICH